MLSDSMASSRASLSHMGSSTEASLRSSITSSTSSSGFPIYSSAKKSWSACAFLSFLSLSAAITSAKEILGATSSISEERTSSKLA